MNKSKLFTKKIPYYGHFDVVFWVAGVAAGLAVTDNYTPENINVDQL